MSVEYTIFTGGPGEQIRQKAVARTLRPEDVVVKVTHSGLCFTDVHQKHREIALGHEGAGIVVKVGPEVKRLKVGDRVGFGILRGVCGRCNECLEGEDMYCPDADTYSSPKGAPDVGSLATHAVISETFAFKIPGGMPSAHAAPFMCAGASVFAPLFRGPDCAKAGERVGIIGIGGLGHLAIQFARAMGAVVVVFSTSSAKREEASQLGAHEFVVFKGVDKLDVEPVKHLLVVSSRQPDWTLFMPALAPRATIYPLTVDPGMAIALPAGAVTVKGLRLHGSFVAPRAAYAPMLAFAAVHDIKPIVEEFPMTLDGIARAFDALESGRLRYRAVLVAQDVPKE